MLPQTLWILLLTLIAITLLTLFFYRTPLGLSVRAVASNSTAPAIVRFFLLAALVSYTRPQEGHREPNEK